MIWNRQPTEPAKWFARFDVYRLLGPNRTIEEAFRLCTEMERSTGQRPGHTWYDAAHRWHWKERAETYDEEERTRLEAIDHNRRLQARERRLTMIDQLLQAVYNVLLMANMNQMTGDDARAWLPTMRLLFKDLVNGQRIELGLPSIAETEQHTGVQFHADDYANAIAELNHWQNDHPQHDPAFITLRNLLSNLYPDEQSARRIAGECGLEINRIAFSPLAVNNWHAVLQESANTGLTDNLLAVIRREYGSSKDLRTAVYQYKESHP